MDRDRALALDALTLQRLEEFKAATDEDLGAAVRLGVQYPDKPFSRDRFEYLGRLLFTIRALLCR